MIVEKFDLKTLGKTIKSIPISNSLLRGFSKDMFCVEAKGTGMSPVINSGDLLICALCEEFKNNDIVVLWNGKELHCKFLLLNGTITIYQNSNREIFNSNGYQLIGKVVSKFSNL